MCLYMSEISDFVCILYACNDLSLWLIKDKKLKAITLK